MVVTNSARMSSPSRSHLKRGSDHKTQVEVQAHTTPTAHTWLLSQSHRSAASPTLKDARKAQVPSTVTRTRQIPVSPRPSQGSTPILRRCPTSLSERSVNHRKRMTTQAPESTQSIHRSLRTVIQATSSDSTAESCKNLLKCAYTAET